MTDSDRLREARLNELRSPEQPAPPPDEEERLRRDAARWLRDRASLTLNHRERSLLRNLLERCIDDNEEDIRRYRARHGKDYEPPPGKRHSNREAIATARAILGRIAPSDDDDDAI